MVHCTEPFGAHLNTGVQLNPILRFMCEKTLLCSLLALVCEPICAAAHV